MFTRNEQKGVAITSDQNYETVKIKSSPRNICQTIATSIYHSSFPSTKNQSDDQLITGVTQQGYPFMITVDGFYGCSNKFVFKFVNQEITPLIEEYISALTTKIKQNDDINNLNNENEVTTQLIRKIIEQRLKKEYEYQSVDFTLGFTVTFSVDDKIYAAGFSVGDVGTVLRKKDSGEVIQLSYNTKVTEIITQTNSSSNLDSSFQKDNSYKDGFDDYTIRHPSIRDYTIRHPSIRENMLKRCSKFLLPIKIGDELLSYTYVPDELEIGANEYLDNNIKVEKLALNPQIFTFSDKTKPMIRRVWNSVKNVHKQLIESKKNENHRFGDDCSISSIKIPNEEERAALLQENNFILELRDYITQREKEGDTFWGSFFGFDKKEKVFAANQMLQFLSGNNYSLSSYTIKALNDSRLGTIVRKYQELNVSMPKEFESETYRVQGGVIFKVN